MDDVWLQVKASKNYVTTTITKKLGVSSTQFDS